MEHHMYSKHKDVKMHICDQCPFKTNSLTNLTRHIDNMHLAIKYESTNGQIISKCLFCVFNFFQKTKKDMSHGSKNQFICSLFG